MRNRILLITIVAFLSGNVAARAQNNAYEYFEQAAIMLDKVNSTTPHMLEENNKLTEQNTPVLALIAKGLALPYYPPQEQDPELALARYSRWRKLAQFVKVYGDAQASQNNWHGAANAYLDIIKFGVVVTHDGTLMDLLVGQSLQAIGRRALQENLSHLDATVAQNAARRLETITAFSPSFADILRNDFAANKTQIKLLMPDEAVQREYQQLQQRQAEDAARPYILTRQKPAFEDVKAVKSLEPEELKELPPPPVYARIAFKIVLPVYQQGRLSETIHRTQNQMLIAALALRAYQASRGKYPTGLDELVPVYLEKIPIDPFALHSPLIYKNAGEKYSLYSVGADGKDDDALPVKKEGETRRQEYSAYRAGADARGDIVFGVNP